MKIKLGSWSLTPYLMVVLFLGLQACGGGTPPPAAANPVGYYAGTFNYSTPTGQGTTATDTAVKAIVDSDKFLMVHIDHTTPDTILYKGIFTDITATTFTANVKIYRNGTALTASAIDATITNGSITEKSSMSGTLSGTGGDYTNTSFNLNYDQTVNARATTNLLRGSTDTWVVPNATASTGLAFNSATNTAFSYSTSTIVDASLRGCGQTDTPLENVPGEQTDRIQKYINLPLIGTCSTTQISGYVTPYDNGGTDNRYLWINYNDTVFFAADELTHHKI